MTRGRAHYEVLMTRTHSLRHCDREPKAWREATQGDTSGACRAALGCFVASLLAMTRSVLTQETKAYRSSLPWRSLRPPFAVARASPSAKRRRSAIPGRTPAAEVIGVAVSVSTTA